MSKVQLESGLVADFRPAGSGGVEVYKQAERLLAVLREQIGETAAHTLAWPVIDDQGSRIDWYTLLDGQPRNWADLAESEREKIATELGNLDARVTELAQRLTRDSSSPHHLLARHLALALRIPSNSHCFLVGNQPVLTFWGFDPLDADGSARAAVIRPWHWSRDSAPAPSPSGDGTASNTASGTGSSTIRNRHPVAAQTRSDPRPHGWIPWWIWLLLLLILLLSSAWFLSHDRSDTPPSETSGHQSHDSLPDQSPAEPGTTQLPSPSAESPPADTVPLPQPPSEPTPEAVLPAIEPDPVTPALAVPEPPESPEENTEPDTEFPKVGTLLVIPPEARSTGSVDFLNGLWRAETELLDADTQMPVELEYAITDGAGELRVSRHDGGSCHAPVTARMDAGNLIVEGPDPIRCSDGAVFGRPRLRCHTGSDGHTECTGQNPDDSQFQVQLRRTGGPGADSARSAARPGPNLATP